MFSLFREGVKPRPVGDCWLHNLRINYRVSVLQEFKTCNLESCPEVRRNTPWTPWMPVNVSHDGSRQEQRYRYICRALLPRPQQLQLGKKKLETRFCPNDGSEACHSECESQTPELCFRLMRR